MEQILQHIPEFKTAADAMREVVLANLVLIAEAPAPTGREERRIRVLLERFNEAGVQQCSIDDRGSGFGVLPGTEGTRTILIATNADSLGDRPEDAHVEIGTTDVVGPFLGDNSLALAAMASLPLLLDRLGIKLRSNLVLMGAARMFGRCNLEGLSYFLGNAPLPIKYGVCLKGVQLGRLNYSCLGMMLVDAVTRVPDDYKWAQFGTTGSIVPMNDLINRINKIALPRRPMTSIIFGMLKGGFTYGHIARQTVLSFEVRSESAEMLGQIAQQLEDIGEDVAANSGVSVHMDVFARRQPGGLDISHPLVRQAKAVQGTLGIQSILYPTTSAMACFVERKIPALTIGCATPVVRTDLDELQQPVVIASLADGLAQLAGILLAIDGGHCDAQ